MLRNQATKTIAEVLGTDEATSFGVLVATIIVLLSTFLFFLVVSCSRRSGADLILLLGLSSSGKTKLFTLLVNNTEIESYVSMKENIWNGSLASVGGKGQFHLVDVPGHDKIRKQIFDQYKGRTKGLIFIVDSFSFSKEAKDVAEFLYDILCDPIVGLKRKKLPILIACNKQDVSLAKSVDVIKNQLEKEFTLLNTTRAASLESTDGSVENKNVLGQRGKSFDFSHLGQKVQFCECSATKNSKSLKNINNWLINM